MLTSSSMVKKAPRLVSGWRWRSRATIFKRDFWNRCYDVIQDSKRSRLLGIQIKVVEKWMTTFSSCCVMKKWQLLRFTTQPKTISKRENQEIIAGKDKLSSFFLSWLLSSLGKSTQDQILTASSADGNEKQGLERSAVCLSHLIRIVCWSLIFRLSVNFFYNAANTQGFFP